MSETRRRSPRYPVNLRLRLQLPVGELETETLEVSLEGFSARCTPRPQPGTQFGFVVHLPDGTPLSGTVTVARVSDTDEVAGFSAEFAPADLPVWTSYVQQEADSGGLWRMIGRYALNGGAEKEAARSVLEKGPLGVLFMNLGGKKSAEHEDAPIVIRLHMVGENGEAYRVAFEKHGGVKPEESGLATLPGFVELAVHTVARVLPREIYLKPSPHARVQAACVVELLRGGFAMVTQAANAKLGLVSLNGNELIGIQLDGLPVYPFFVPAELDRIALDTFRRASPVPAPAPPPSAPVLVEERNAESYTHHEVTTSLPPETSQVELRQAMAVATRVQTRTYGPRTIRLFPELWLEVHRPGETPVRGFAMEDGPLVCAFVLQGQDAPRVMVLERSDVIALIRRGA